MADAPSIRVPLKKQITYLANNLGVGLVRPVAYDTAWVARVPSLSDPRQPAFPEALQWLRDHQFADGSWGTARPFYAHGNTLSTLASVLAFAEWKKDGERIETALESLFQTANYLPYESYESIGFELLLPALQEEAQQHNLPLPDEAYARYTKLQQAKQHLIRRYQTAPSTPRAWWFSFEAMTNEVIFQDGFTPEHLLTTSGSVGLSPAATASLLRAVRLHGGDLPAAEGYLRTLLKANNHGVPHVGAIDGAELAFGIDYFLRAGISATDPVLAPAMELLNSRFNHEFGFGYSSHFIPDADDTAVALRALSMAGAQVDPATLLKYFNGVCMSAYPDERVYSISCNIHALTALKRFAGTPEVDTAISSILAWVESKARSGGPIFDDKWHFSPFYATSRAVFALKGLNDALAKRCIDWILDQQGEYGWSICGESTLEETAHASLALCFWKREGHYIPQDALVRAYHFLSMYGTGWPEDELWIGKTLYCQTIATAAAIAAAKYALENALD